LADSSQPQSIEERSDRGVRMPFHINNKRIIKLPNLGMILLGLTFISFIIILGFLLFPLNGRPNFDKLPFTLDWEFSQVNGRIQAIVPDGVSVLLVTNNALEKYDNQQNLLWQIKISDYWKSINKPILDENHLYFDDTESIVAINKNTGQNIWSTKHPNGIIADSKFLGVSKGRVFIELYDHGLYAVDTVTGEIVWNLHYSREYAGIHFYEDQIIILLTKQILIVDVKNGNVINEVVIGISKSSTSDGEKIFYGEGIDFGNNKLQSYDINTGEINTIYRSSEEINCIILDKDIIYINTGLKIIKLTTSGKVFWAINYPKDYINSMYSSENILFVIDARGRFFSLDTNNGRYVGEIRDYRLKDTAMYAINKDNNHLIDLLLANNHDVYNFKEIN
jgi:outer membrane protein assembly factor BamB